MSENALDLMWALVLEDDRRWGDVAVEHQKADMEALFAPAPAPTLQYWTRPRGGSKTTDVAGASIAWLATDAPPRANGRVVAASGEQASILIDAAAGFVARTPELEGVLTVEAERIIGPNGAWVKILAQSDSGSWGLRDCHLLILDEFAQWPETRGAKRVYTAIRSAVQKVKGCRMVILTSAGEPSHWSYEKFKEAQQDPLGLWRVSEMPGPVSWQSPAHLEALRRELRPSEYDRLILNIWSEDEDRAISEEDFDRAAVNNYRSLGPKDGIRYLITVDIGILHDATVMCVSHKEPLNADEPRGAKRVVVDHVERWQGTRRKPVQLIDVENWIVREAPRWNHAEVHADPTQFVGNLQNLNRRGVKAREWPFTATSVGEVATALVQAFRSRQIWVPNIPELKEELLRVRLRESAPGVTRLDHDKGGHDDQAVVLGMACLLHIGNHGWGDGGAFAQSWNDEIYKRQSQPKQPKRERSVREFFGAAPTATNPAVCRKPRFFDGVCVNCGVCTAAHRKSA